MQLDATTKLIWLCVLCVGVCVYMIEFPAQTRAGTGSAGRGRGECIQCGGRIEKRRDGRPCNGGRMHHACDPSLKESNNHRRSPSYSRKRKEFDALSHSQRNVRMKKAIQL